MTGRSCFFVFSKCISVRHIVLLQLCRALFRSTVELVWYCHKRKHLGLFRTSTYMLTALPTIPVTEISLYLVVFFLAKTFYNKLQHILISIILIPGLYMILVCIKNEKIVETISFFSC